MARSRWRQFRRLLKTNSVRALPDPDLSLRDASDFIFDSDLARRALEDPNPRPMANFIREIVQTLYRLTTSCHLPEFTDHGLGHICSVVDRLSNWTRIGSGSTTGRVVEGLSSSEAGILLVAVLLHDIGMLSQRPEDMPPGDSRTRPLSDIPGWVRETHVKRLPRLATRLFRGTRSESTLAQPLIQRAVSVAQAHSRWPWSWTSFAFIERDAGLAAMLAVGDLLDEDSMRCDSETLLRHRYGTPVNAAHWIRHSLTDNRVLVVGGKVAVRLACPPQTDARFGKVLDALRNHYRLVLLYNSELAEVGANLRSVDFDPPVGLTSVEALKLDNWWELPEFATQAGLIYHLFGSFMAEALLDSRRLASDVVVRLNAIGIQPIDLTEYYKVRGLRPPRTLSEQSFHALADP